MTDVVPALLHLTVPSQGISEGALAAGYDGIIVDLQHGEIGVDQAVTMLRSLPRSVLDHAWGRIPSIDSGIIGRLLDSGARGIVAPTVETVEQARALAAAAKYPPIGGRSVGPTRPSLYEGESYTEAANAVVKAVIQIETARGVEAAHAIFATPGIDSVYVGPADLAVTYGLPGRGDWREGPVWDAILRLSPLARDHGLTVGIFSAGPSYAAMLIERGLIDYVGLGIDLMYVNQKAKQNIDELRSKA